MSADIILEVHQTADGYSIYYPDRKTWWGVSYRYGYREVDWHNKWLRKTYEYKWCAVRKAKKLEEKMNAGRREGQRRSTFVEKKVWR
jgi:hypothetical protein